MTVIYMGIAALCAVAALCYLIKYRRLLKIYNQVATRYNNIFCSEPKCLNIKHYKFKYCLAHIPDDPDMNALDPPDMERPCTGDAG